MTADGRHRRRTCAQTKVTSPASTVKVAILLSTATGPVRNKHISQQSVQWQPHRSDGQVCVLVLGVLLLSGFGRPPTCHALSFVTPKFATSYTVDAASPGTISAVTAADIDGDGDMDVLASGLYVSWYESDGGSPPMFLQHRIGNATGGSAGCSGALAVADLNQVRTLTA